MLELNGARIIAQQLKNEGIDTVFGVVAGPMIEVMAAMAEEGINVINCRHEESAAFAASAWGWQKGKAGVCVVGSGPAQTNTITPMYVATESGMPLVVLGGSSRGNQRGLGAFQEANQVTYAEPVCKWSVQVDNTSRIAEYVHLALGRATSGRPGAIYVDFPAEFIGKSVSEDEVIWRQQSPHIAPAAPDSEGLNKIAELLSEAEHPLIIVGKGAGWANAGTALEQLVSLGIPFVTSPMGRGTIPDDDPMFFNGARSVALAEADAVLMIGGRYNWIFQFGQEPRFRKDVRLAQIDISAEEFYSGADLEIGVTADCRLASEQLYEILRTRTLRSSNNEWVQLLQKTRNQNESRLAEAMDSDEKPINHFRLLRELRDVVERDATLSVDAELTMGVARAVLPSFGPRLRLNSGTTGCMGTGFPYAIGAKLARPEKQSIAILGDYAFGAAAMEVETCARVGANVVIILSNNGGIAGHTIQNRMFTPDAPPIAAMLPIDYEHMVKMVGGHAQRVEDPKNLQSAIKKALASETISLVNVLTDPEGTRSGSAYLG